MPAPPPSPVSPKPSYPRPASIGSPVRNRWGVGRLSSKPGEVYIGGMGGTNKNVPLSAFSGKGIWASLSPQAQAKLYKDATDFYGYAPDASYMDSFVETTAANAYAVQQSTGLLVDPLSYWDYYRQTGGYGMTGREKAGGGGGGGGGGGVSRSTSISQSVDLTDPTAARGLVDQALARYLGRGATNEEYANFTKALNRAERKNPNISRTTSVTSGGAGGVTAKSKSLSKGGIDRGRFAEEWAMSQEGAAEYAAATTVLDSFMKVLGE